MKREIKKPTNRIEKVNSLVQQIVSLAIRPHIENYEGLVTVSKVDTSRDMKWAKVWISIVGGNDKQLLGAINKNIYDIQGELIHAMATKIVPRLQFFLDTAPRYVDNINEVIKKIHEEDETKS